MIQVDFRLYSLSNNLVFSYFFSIANDMNRKIKLSSSTHTHTHKPTAVYTIIRKAIIVINSGLMVAQQNCISHEYIENDEGNFIKENRNHKRIHTTVERALSILDPWTMFIIRIFIIIDSLSWAPFSIHFDPASYSYHNRFLFYFFFPALNFHTHAYQRAGVFVSSSL